MNGDLKKQARQHFQCDCHGLHFPRTSAIFIVEHRIERRVCTSWSTACSRLLDWDFQIRSTMRVVALIRWRTTEWHVHCSPIDWFWISSGGKDSTYNMIQCVHDGHELVALANLHPSKDIGMVIFTEEGRPRLKLFVDELDSYMYQSVGHEVIDLFAQAMELPLYRAETKGTAQTTEKEYPQATKGDEVEDLYDLLCHVKVTGGAESKMLDILVLPSIRNNIRSMRCLSVLSFRSIRIIAWRMCKSSFRSW